MEETELLCYNRGCGKTFKDSQNGPKVCTFHPGEPYFHDAYKIWTCCNRKCVDFTEFLSMVGCTTGFHSNFKPIVDEKETKKQNEDVGKYVDIPEPLQRLPRPDVNLPLTDLKQDIAPSLLNNKVSTSTQSSNSNDESVTELSKKCLNQGCSMEFINRNEIPICTYHPGQPIFHEGLKFWSCCKKKSMEFDEFLSQKGCVQGKHLWKGKKKIDCRVDWHQTASHVFLTMYTKGYVFRNVKIQANGVKLFVSVELPGGNFEKEWLLFGIVNQLESTALLQTTKIEIKLRKAEPLQWTNLI